jgi:hypothetical protein
MSIKAKADRAKTDYDRAYAAGKQAEYDAFWDAYQDNGKRTSYNYAFYHSAWDDNLFKPKYDIRPVWSIVGAFQYCGVTDLETRLKECGVVLDTSNNANYGSVFANAKFTVLPEIVFSGFATTVYTTFSSCNSLHTIRKITLKDGFNAEMTDTFKNCTALENVVFEGVIPKNINMQWSTKLTKASITSVINALSTTATGQTATFSQTAVNNAFTTAERDALIATKSNWTIALA